MSLPDDFDDRRTSAGDLFSWRDARPIAVWGFLASMAVVVALSSILLAGPHITITERSAMTVLPKTPMITGSVDRRSRDDRIGLRPGLVGDMPDLSAAILQDLRNEMANLHRQIQTLSAQNKRLAKQVRRLETARPDLPGPVDGAAGPSGTLPR